MVPRRSHRSTGLRPTLSERQLHWNTVAASAAKYKDIYRFCQRATEESQSRTDETYNQPCVVFDLFFVTTNDWELTNKLRRTLLTTYMRKI